MHERTEVDMSPEAIDRRLREISQLRRLGLSFQGMKDLGRVEDLGLARFKLPSGAAAKPEGDEREAKG